VGVHRLVAPPSRQNGDNKVGLKATTFFAALVVDKAARTWLTSILLTFGEISGSLRHSQKFEARVEHWQLL